MIEHLISEIQKEILSIQEELKSAGFEVTILQTENGAQISLSYVDNSDLKELIESFKEFIQDIPDFLFEEVCTLYNTKNSISLNELSSLMKEARDEAKIVDAIGTFKDCTVEVAQKCVNGLIAKYSLD